MIKIIFYGFLWMVSCSALAAGPDEGMPAPHLEGRYLDGAAFNTRDMQGKVIIVDFWATWCPPCREEMPILDNLYKKYHRHGLEIIGVNIEDKTEAPNVRVVMKPFSFPAALLGEVKAEEFGRIWRVPLTFVIDRHGILRKNGGDGETKISASEMEKAIIPLLAEQ